MNLWYLYYNIVVCVVSGFQHVDCVIFSTWSCFLDLMNETCKKRKKTSKKREREPEKEKEREREEEDEEGVEEGERTEREKQKERNVERVRAIERKLKDRITPQGNFFQ